MVSESSPLSASQPTGNLDSVAEEASRSVYSPTAYLAELLKVVGAEKELAERRPDLAALPAAENGSTEVPYLDVVIEILKHELERSSGGQRILAELSKPTRNRQGEQNLRTRDKLVAALLAELDLQDPRELSDRFLIDVETGAQPMTSRVREGIAAVQLYLQRYLPGREADGMSSYREWAAARKRLLYPENYLRPSLRPDRTPAFAALERDLIADKPSDAAIEQAFRRYLDQYTEVSRLIVAGGFVDAGTRRVVLLGRTRTEPRRYYYRHAELGASTEQWAPWLPVDVPIDADQVRPVEAFGRLFVFWTATESQQVRIRYSYLKLDNEWAPAQTLGTSAREDGTIAAINLIVRPQTATITVSCSYTVSADGQSDRRAATLFTLHPELYVDAVPTGTALALATDLEVRTEAAATADRVARIFVDPVPAAEVVRFDVPDGAESWPWFSVDVRGGSFLCRPVVITESEDAPLRPLRGNPDRLAEWDRIDAAFELPEGNRYFFDNERGRFAVIPARGGRMTAALPINSRFGRLPSALPMPGPVDAVLTRAGQHTYVFIGDRCLRYTGPAFGQVDAGYPQPIEQAAVAERLPVWPRIDFAFTDVDGTEWFGQQAADLVVSSDELDRPIRMTDFQQRLNLNPDFGRIVTVLVSGPRTYVIGETRYARYTHRRPGRSWWEGLDAGYPRALQGNPDGLPDDRTISEALAVQDTVHYIDNRSGTLLTVGPDGNRTTRPLHATSEMANTSQVDAAWLTDNKLYLTCGGEFHRYTLGADQTIPEYPDPGYPQALPHPIDAAFRRGDQLYLFSGDRYCRIPVGQEPSTLPDFQPVAGAWAELPRPSGTPFDAALDSADGLFLFVRDSYHRHAKSLAVVRPYELAALPFELVRLTTGTAAGLNHALLTGGLPALLSPATQQAGERPVSTDGQLADAIRVRAELVDLGRLTGGLGLDFSGANGLYHWEIFDHLPLLIAQRLQAGHRFADARRWFEHVFDPADIDAPWQSRPLRNPDPSLDAHRHAVVLAYLDNLLQWAELLLQQSTRDGTAEARLLYLMAQDLLGAGLLASAPLDPELLDELTGGGLFTIPGNEVIAGLRSRVADGLHRIRESLSSAAR